MGYCYSSTVLKTGSTFRSIQIEKIGSAYIYIHIYPIHIICTLRWWFHLGSAYLHIMSFDTVVANAVDAVSLGCDTRPRWARHSEWNIVVVKVKHWTHFWLFVWPMIWEWLNKCLFLFCWRIVDWTWQTFCFMPITDSIRQLIEWVSFVFGRLCSCHSVIALGGQLSWNWSKVAVNRDLLNVVRAVWFPVFWTCHRPHHVSGVRGPGNGSLFFRWIAYVIYPGSCLIARPKGGLFR